MSIDFKSVEGSELEPYVESLGLLRVQVFRQFPYLYDGDLDYEKKYLKTYIASPRSLVVLAMDTDKIVGASTCIPLEDESSEFQIPFLQAEMDLSKVCYFGESILLEGYRGQGVGHRFFDLREGHAKRVIPELEYTAFCAVDRPDDHPLRPKPYRSHDAFWDKRGYRKQPNMKAEYQWKDIDQESETKKQMTFWLRRF